MFFFLMSHIHVTIGITPPPHQTHDHWIFLTASKCTNPLFILSWKDLVSPSCLCVLLLAPDLCVSVMLNDLSIRKCSPSKSRWSCICHPFPYQTTSTSPPPLHLRAEMWILWLYEMCNNKSAVRVLIKMFAQEPKKKSKLLRVFCLQRLRSFKQTFNCNSHLYPNTMRMVVVLIFPFMLS